MPTQQSIDEDKTLTNENTLDVNHYSNNHLGQDNSSDKASAYENNFSCHNEDNVDETLKLKESRHVVNPLLLAKIIVESTYSSCQNDQIAYNSNLPDQQRLLYAELNDIVQIEEQIDEKWFLAKSDQTIGKLHSSSCRLLDKEVPLTLCRYLYDNRLFELHVCFASFVAQDVGDLSLTKGDIIVAIKSVNEHWIQGQVCFDGQANIWPTLELDKQIGSFPLNHCWQLDSKRIELFCKHKNDEFINNTPHLKIISSSTSSSSSSNLPFHSNATTTKSAVTNSAQHYDHSNHSRRLAFLTTAHSSSLSSRSSSAFSSVDQQPFASSTRQYSKYYDTTDNSSQNSNNKMSNSFNIHTNDNHINNNHTSQSNFNVISNSSTNITGPLKQQQQQQQQSLPQPPPRPTQLPIKQLCQSFSSSNRKKSSSEQAVVSIRGPTNSLGSGNIIISSKQQDKLKGWLHTVRKKTARLSTRITASLGLISLPRDEQFERHYESFKQLEKTLRNFIKNISAFVEHYESFLLSLQHTSDNLAEFYRDKPQNQNEFAELKRKNKALQCEHFHAFKRTIDRQVIANASQLLQKFSGPHQLISKRSAKLIDFDSKTKELESCRDIEKKAVLHDQYVIAKNLYDRLNNQLIEELALFNHYALDIFRECILVLLDSRRNLIVSYTKQTENLLKTPLMSSYTASDVVSSIMMSCNNSNNNNNQRSVVVGQQSRERISSRLNNTEAPLSSGEDKQQQQQLCNQRQLSGTGTQPSGSSGDGGDVPFSDNTSASRPHSAMSQLSSDFDRIDTGVAREISSTPLSNMSVSHDIANDLATADDDDAACELPVDEIDAATTATTNGRHRVRIDISRISNGSSDNRHNESIESRIEAASTKPFDSGSTPPPPQPPPISQAVADSDLDENVMQQLKSRLNFNNGYDKMKRRNKKSQPIYIASWPFKATGPNQLTIVTDQHLKLVKDRDECGNADWSLVKDKRGHLGYVPSSYIKKRE